MIIVGRSLLNEYQKKHVQSSRPLFAWERIMTRNHYSSFPDLRKTFSKADYVFHRYTIFNIGGNKFRLITLIDYIDSIVYVKILWTHAEYDKTKSKILLKEWAL